mgnify:CR=1 FL=1
MGKTTRPSRHQNFHYDRVYTDGYSLLRSPRIYHKSQGQNLDTDFVPLSGQNVKNRNHRKTLKARLTDNLIISSAESTGSSAVLAPTGAL